MVNRNKITGSSFTWGSWVRKSKSNKKHKATIPCRHYGNLTMRDLDGIHHDVLAIY